jgi:hypothetical protein
VRRPALPAAATRRTALARARRRARVPRTRRSAGPRLTAAHLPRGPTRGDRTIRRVRPAGRRRCARRDRPSRRGPVRLRASILLSTLVWLSASVWLVSPVWLGGPVCLSDLVPRGAGLGNYAGPGRAQHGVQDGVVGRGSGLDDDRNGLSVVLGLACRRPSARVDNARHHPNPRRTELPVSIRCDILTATATHARSMATGPALPS